MFQTFRRFLVRTSAPIDEILRRGGVRARASRWYEGLSLREWGQRGYCCYGNVVLQITNGVDDVASACLAVDDAVDASPKQVGVIVTASQPASMHEVITRSPRIPGYVGEFWQIWAGPYILVQAQQQSAPS